LWDVAESHLRAVPPSRDSSSVFHHEAIAARAVAGGAEIKATASRLGVEYREAVRWVTKWRKTGILEPEKMGVKSPLDREAEWLRNLVAGEPDISLSDIREKLAERGVRRSKTSVWNCLERHGIELGGRRKRNAA
jgi:putative transposase